MAAPCYFPPPVNYLGLVWGRTWLPAAAQAGCHTVKDPFINKLSIRCQQPPFGLFGERSCGVESWLDQLEEFKKKKKKARGRCLAVCSPQQTWDMAWAFAGRRGSLKNVSRRRQLTEKYSEQEGSTERSRRLVARGFWVILTVAVSLPQWAAQNQALKMVTKPPARVLKWKVPFAYNLFKVILMKQRCSASPWQPFSRACTLSVNWHCQPLSPQVPRLSSHSMPSDM